MLTLSESAANAACAAVTYPLSGGMIRLYDGARPLRSDTPVSSQRLLAEFRFGTPAFLPPVKGVAQATAMGAATALADGEATWVRVVRADHSTAFDGSVGIADADFIVSTTSVRAGALLVPRGFVYRQKMAA